MYNHGAKTDGECKVFWFCQKSLPPPFSMYSTLSDSSLGHLAFHGSFSPSKTANQSLPVYEKRKFPSKTGRLLQELYKITK